MSIQLAPHCNAEPVRSIVGERLTTAAFQQLSGQLAGYSFIKLVVDKQNQSIHFINNALYKMHVHYISENLLGVPSAQIERDIDSFNRSVYFDDSRRFYLGVLALHRVGERSFFSLETVEVDTMNGEMMCYFFETVRAHLDPTLPLYFKPANHRQESIVTKIDPVELPRIFSHELFASSEYVALNTGRTKGRLRYFASEEAYKENRSTLEWFDIIVMRRVPDDIPRITGIINTKHTTPLSHTNVLASGWQIPNAIQLGVEDYIVSEKLNDAWVEYEVSANAAGIKLLRTEKPNDVSQRPAWSVHKIQLEEPETANGPAANLEQLRMRDRYRYGTKAANLGELHRVLVLGSERLTGFYQVKRPPRANLLPYLSERIRATDANDLSRQSSEFLKGFLKIPRGIALPFSFQREFLESSPKIQQAIGKLKMALELNARQMDALCVSLQQMILQTRMPDKIRDAIDGQIARHLSGVSKFVVRSSSNAEDLENFSAAGIYESINHVTTAENIFESVKQVWASLVSLRSVRLRHEVGISLDDSYMGVVIQEQVPSTMGGVLVTTNPLNKADFRNVYFNISPRSVEDVVQGADQPIQYLYNTVEGGGRTLSLGSASVDLSDLQKQNLQKLAIAGRLLQSHFSPDYTFAQPVDIEWLMNDDEVYILQLRPYAQ
jgi:hypothetical protein